MIEKYDGQKRRSALEKNTEIPRPEACKYRGKTSKYREEALGSPQRVTGIGDV